MGNREIKFRIWNMIEKRMEAVPLDLWQVTNFGLKQIGLNTPDLEFMQYTCLKDKNGREIYEGDLLRYWDGIVEKVEWEPIRAMFLGLFQCDSSEVIGNVFENPELLTKESAG